MIIKDILVILSIIHLSKSEIPKFICLPEKPFQTSDNTCANFSDICVKKDDRQCDNFQAACKQCPPTNFTVSTLLHLKDQVNRSNINQEEIKNQMNISNSRINGLTISLNNIEKKSSKQERILAVCLTFILINFIIYIYALYKMIYEDKYRKKKKNRYVTDEELQNSKLLPIDNQQTTDTNNKRLLKEIQELKNEKEYSALDSVVSYKLRFQIANQCDETELFVSKYDNVIKLKKSICERNMNMNDYKSMIMKYKGVTLDNNKFLLSCIDSTNIPIFCEFDNNVDVNAMIVIKLRCDNIYPEMLQIWKHQKIKDLKMIISELNKTNHKDLLIFCKSDKLDDDDKSIDDYKIEDNDWIKVVIKSEEMLNISMKSIFTDKERISIEISKFETVQSIINKSIQKIQHKMVTNHFSVFLNNKLLDNEKFIYEYNIDNKSLVEFCYFKNLDEIGKPEKLIDFLHITMHKTKHKYTNKSVLLKAYSKEYMETAHNGDLSRILREDLQIFQITKSHPRFMQLLGIYMEGDWIYIELENSTKVSMKLFRSNNNDISIYTISKWAYHILEGLKYLHDHNIILKDMNTTNIWIDGNHDIKLPSFNITDYLDHLNDHKYEHMHSSFGFVAPEILKAKPYVANVDVWSLGVIMIEIVTQGQLFFGLGNLEIIEKIKESDTIEYDKINKPPDLINFIDCCVKGDPTERSTIDQLLKHEFIEKYYL